MGRGGRWVRISRRVKFGGNGRGGVLGIKSIVLYGGASSTVGKGQHLLYIKFKKVGPFDILVQIPTVLLRVLDSHKWIRPKCLLLEPGSTAGPFWTFEINQLPASAQRRSSPRREVPRATGWVLAGWQSVSTRSQFYTIALQVCVSGFFSHWSRGWAPAAAVKSVPALWLNGCT